MAVRWIDIENPFLSVLAQAVTSITIIRPPPPLLFVTSAWFAPHQLSERRSRQLRCTAKVAMQTH
jgi:hypothetical protein